MVYIWRGGLESPELSATCHRPLHRRRAVWSGLVVLVRPLSSQLSFTHSLKFIFCLCQFHHDSDSIDMLAVCRGPAILLRRVDAIVYSKSMLDSAFPFKFW